MKKLMAIIAVVLFCSGLASATSVMVELKANYFSPSEKAFKDIYGGGMMYGVELGIGAWNNLDFWVGGSYFSKKGELTFTKEETKLSIFPIGCGVRYRFSTEVFDFYGGAGLNYCRYKEANPIGEVSKGGLGYVGKIGSMVKITRELVIDLYLNYFYSKIKPAYYKVKVNSPFFEK